MSTQRELSDGQTCADGTEFSVFSEHVRGEPRFYWVMCKLPKGSYRSVDADGSNSRVSMQRLARRLADAHDEDLRSFWYVGPESKIYHTNRWCPRINNRYRYWPISKASEPPRGRRLCKLCEKGST